MSSICTNFVLANFIFIRIVGKKSLITVITEGIQEKKGTNIVVVDLRKIEGSICNYFIIAQGGSPSQVEAITDSISEFALKAGEKPTHVIGLESCQWVAMDYTDVMVHIFLPEVREYYDLEHLWEDAKLKRIPDLD